MLGCESFLSQGTRRVFKAEMSYINGVIHTVDFNNLFYDFTLINISEVPTVLHNEGFFICFVFYLRR